MLLKSILKTYGLYIGGGIIVFSMLLYGIISVFLMGSGLISSLVPNIPELGLVYDTADNFYSVPIKITPGIGNYYTSLSDMKTYDDNAKVLSTLKINGLFLANKKLKIVDKYLFLSSFVEKDFETLLSGKEYYKFNQEGITVNGLKNVNRTTYIIKNSFYKENTGSGNANNINKEDTKEKISVGSGGTLSGSIETTSIGNNTNFNLYTNDSSNTNEKYLGDNLNFLMKTEAKIPYFYFNIDNSQHFGFLYPYRMSYGVIIEGNDSLNNLFDYSIYDNLIGENFDLFSTIDENSFVEAMKVCEETTGDSKPACYVIPKSDSFEEGNKFYFKNKELSGKERDFESIFDIKYDYITISGKKYISQIHVSPKTKTFDKKYISIFDKSFISNSTGYKQIFEKDFSRIDTFGSQKNYQEYLISENFKNISKYFFINSDLKNFIINQMSIKKGLVLPEADISLSGTVSLSGSDSFSGNSTESGIKNSNSGMLKKEKVFEYELSNKNLFLDINPYLLIHSFYQTYVSEENNSFFKIKASGFLTTEKNIDSYNFIKDIGTDTIKSLNSFGDESLFPNNLQNQTFMEKDFDKNLSLIISGFDYKKEIQKKKELDLDKDFNKINISLFSNVDKPQDSSFWGLRNEDIKELDSSINIINVYNLFNYSLLKENSIKTDSEKTEEENYKKFFSGQKDQNEENKSIWQKGLDQVIGYGKDLTGLIQGSKAVLIGNIGKIINPIKRIKDSIKTDFSSFTNIKNTYSCDKAGKIDEIKKNFDKIKEVVKENYGNKQIERILSILQKNNISFINSDLDTSALKDKIGELEVNKETITGEYNVSEGENKIILGKKLSEINKEIEGLKTQVSTTETNSSKRIEDILKNLSDNISLKKSLLDIAKQEGNNEEIEKTTKELNTLESDYNDIKEVKDNYSADIEKTFSVLTAFQSYNLLLQQVSILENCMITGNDGDFFKENQALLENYNVSKKLLETELQTLEEKKITITEEIYKLTSDINFSIDNVEMKNSILSMNNELISNINDIKNKKEELNLLKVKYDSQVNDLIKKYGTDKIISLSYRNEKLTRDLEKEELSRESEIKDKNLSNIKEVGLKNLTFLIKNSNNLLNYKKQYDLNITEINNLEKLIISSTNINEKESYEIKKTNLIVKNNILEKSFDNYFSQRFDSGGKKGIENITIGELEKILNELNQEKIIFQSKDNANIEKNLNTYKFFDEKDIMNLNVLNENELKKKIIQDFKNGNFSHYYTRFKSSYTDKNLGFFDYIYKKSGDFISDSWTEGGNKDLLLYYNLFVFYKGIIDLKLELDNNQNIITKEIYPLLSLKNRFGTFGKMYFPNVSEGEFIIDNVDEFSKISSLNLSFLNSTQETEKLKEDLRNYINNMNIDYLFETGGKYSDYGSTGTGNLLYKELLTNKNIKFIKEHEDIFNYDSSFSGNLDKSILNEKNIISYFTNNALNPDFYKIETLSGFLIKNDLKEIDLSLSGSSLVDSSGLNGKVAYLKSKKFVLLKLDNLDLKKFYTGYLKTIYRKLLIEKYVDGFENDVDEFLKLEDKTALDLYAQFKGAIDYSNNILDSSLGIGEAQKQGFNKELSSIGDKLCSSFSYGDTRKNCSEYISYLQKKPTIKSFLEEIEYSTSVTQLTKAFGWIYPRTSNFKVVRASIPPYDKTNGGLVGQCVRYIQVRKDAKGGDALSWGSQGTILLPKGDYLSKLNKGDVVVFSLGEYGHIAIVEEIDQKTNKVLISESNYGYQGKITIRWIDGNSWLIKHYITGIKDKYENVK